MGASPFHGLRFVRPGAPLGRRKRVADDVNSFNAGELQTGSGVTVLTRASVEICASAGMGGVYQIVEVLRWRVFRTCWGIGLR
jgi:hypothetical protein